MKTRTPIKVTIERDGETLVFENCTLSIMVQRTDDPDSEKAFINPRGDDFGEIRVMLTVPDEYIVYAVEFNPIAIDAWDNDD